MTIKSGLSHVVKSALKRGRSVGPSSVLPCEGGKTERESAGRGGKEGRRTGGVKHQVTVYIPPRRHVAQTEEHQPLSLGKFTRQGQVYYTVVLMHRLTTLHSISLSMLHNTSHLLPLRWFSYYQYLCGWMFALTDFHLLLTDLLCVSVDSCEPKWQVKT